MSKNIHLLPIDKPSRLLRNGKELLLVDIPKIYTFFGDTISVNIYITSDEEIKEGDWYVNTLDEVVRKNNTINHSYHKKIILTTDQDLIGVQAISDDFLKWFVKNPSCEEVEVEKGCILYNFKYKIIIPKEEPRQIDEKGNPLTFWGGLAEPKQDLPQLGTMKELERGITITHVGKPKQETLEEVCCNCGKSWYNTTNPLNVFCFLCGEPKQETLEEFIEKTINESFEIELASSKIEKYMKLGAKWQQEQDKNKYNSQEVEKIAKDAYSMGRNNMLIGVFNKWFEQFKNK